MSHLTRYARDDRHETGSTVEFDTRLFEFTEDEKAGLPDRHAASQAMLSPCACRDDEGIRDSRSATKTGRYLRRPCFVVDVEKIVHNPFYSRCADKNRRSSLVRNDDTRVVLLSPAGGQSQWGAPSAWRWPQLTS